MGTPHDKAEVFILESLDYEDEAENRCDGQLLAQALELYGKTPIYYYFRTEKELVHLAEEFRKVRYRYLHLSCHASASEVCTTHDTLSYTKFAKIFEKKLNNRRLFASACKLGNEDFSVAMKKASGGLQSVVAPTTAIGFNRSAAFWPAFYFLMFDIDNQGMKLGPMKKRLVEITRLFGVHLHLSWNSAHENKLLSMRITPKKGVVDERSKIV